MKDAVPILLHFGMVVKNLRREKQLSQEELANRCRLHRTYITDIEHGTRNVSLKNISKIAHAMDVPLQDVFARVDQYSQDGVHLIARTQDHSGSPRHPIEILLVEEDQDSIELTLQELHQRNISNKIHIMRSGEEAIKFLYTGQPEGNTAVHIPKVLLLELELPGISGLDVLEKIRSDKRTKQIPVIAMTSSAAEIDKERCHQLGVEEYLAKPLNIDSFSAVMRRMGFQLLLLQGDTAVRP